MTETPDGRPFAFHDLPENKFPFAITAFGRDGEVLWTRTVEPYVAVEIPGTGPGSVPRVLVEFADGTREEVFYDGPSTNTPDRTV